MPDYICWQQLESTKLVVTNSDLVKDALLERDHNYNLRITFTASGASPREVDAILSELQGLDQIDAQGERIPLSYQIKGLAIDGATIHSTGCLSITGIAAQIESFYQKDAAGTGEFMIVWMLNCSKELSYPEILRIRYNEKTEYSWGTFATDNFDTPTKDSLSRSAITLEYDGIQFLFGKVEGLKGGPSKGSYIRFKTIDPMTEDQIVELADVLGYSLEVSLIPVGWTHYNRKSSPVKQKFISTFEKDIDKFLTEIELPTIPIRIPDHHAAGINPEEQINRFLKAYNAMNKKYGLRKVLWYISYARNQNPLVKTQPLATAFDLLSSAHYKGKPNTTISKQEFDVVMKQIHIVLDHSVPNIDKRKMILQRMKNANSTSMNVRNKAIFEDLHLDLSQLEKDALQSRNKAVHGTLGNLRVKQIIIESSAFYVLISRLVLRILNMPLYIDWSVRDRPVGQVDRAQQGNFGVQGL